MFWMGSGTIFGPVKLIVALPLPLLELTTPPTRIAPARIELAIVIVALAPSVAAGPPGYATALLDVVKIADIKDEVDSTNKRWTEQFCSANERAHAGTTPTRYRYYASCFAGKEAVTKALGTGFAGDITWRGIEILRRESGAPYVRLSGEVLELASNMGITDWFISISYLDEIAMVSVIAVGNDCAANGG